MIANSLPFYLKCQWPPLNTVCVKGMWKELSTITKFLSGFKVEPKFGIFKRFRLNPCGLCSAAAVACQNGTLGLLQIETMKLG